MADQAPLELMRSRVARDWVDYNGHMNDACYCIVFSRAVDEFMAYIGVDEAYRTNTRYSIYTLETHVCYLQEVREGEPLLLTLQLLENDAKKARVFLRMLHAETRAPLATSEQLLLHVDQSVSRAAPFPATVAAKVAALAEAQRTLPLPERAGQGIALSRSKIQ